MLYIIILSTKMEDKKINKGLIAGVESLRIPFSLVVPFFLYDENKKNIVQNK